MPKNLFAFFCKQSKKTLARAIVSLASIPLIGVGDWLIEGKLNDVGIAGMVIGAFCFGLSMSFIVQRFQSMKKEM